MPWNPMIVEQRIGRVDRIGQKNQVLALNILLDNSIEKRVYEVIETKLDQIMIELGIDKTADVLDSTIERDSINRLYLTSLLDPVRFEQESKTWLEEIKKKLNDYRSTEGALPSVNSNDIKVEKVESIKHSPLPVWLEGLTKSYLATKGILYQQLLVGLKFKFPGYKENIYTFNIRESLNNPIPEPLSLQHEIIQNILSEAIPYHESNVIPIIKLMHGKATPGYWSIWHLEVKNQFESSNLFQPVFISDDGDSFSAYAQEIWLKIIQENDFLNCVGVINRDKSKTLYIELFNKIEEILQKKYSEIDEKITANTNRIRINREKAFAFQEKQLQKIGIENIKQSRLQRLLKEKELWLQNFDSSKQTVPDLKCLVLLRISNE